jgi:hypothetical protein
VLGVACVSFTLGTYAKDVSVADAKSDENTAGFFINESMTFHAFVDDIQKPWKTDLGGHLVPAQQAAIKLMEELKAGREWCRSVSKGK